jgi:RNA polymerase sigma factor (sigma-70 family)
MDAFQEVYDRHSPAVRRFALFLTGDVTAADDLVAEVFVRAWLARERIQFGTVRAYLMTIARNLHRDHYRAAGPLLIPIDEAVVDRVPSVEARLASAAHLRGVRARLRRVARGDRQALLLYVVRELPYADIARRLGISIGAVKSRIARARAALQVPSEVERVERRR